MSGQRIIQGLKEALEDAQQTVVARAYVGGSFGALAKDIDISATYWVEYERDGYVYRWEGIRPKRTKDPEVVKFELPPQEKKPASTAMRLLKPKLSFGRVVLI